MKHIIALFVKYNNDKTKESYNEYMLAVKEYAKQIVKEL